MREKHPKLSRIPSRPRVVYLNEAPTGHCLANIEKGGVNSVMDGRTDPSNSDGGGGCVRVRESVCVCTCVRACVMCLQYTIIIFDQADNDNN